jgi:hypothetical protein
MILEDAWGNMKRYVRNNNQKFTPTEAKSLLLEATQRITDLGYWEKFCQMVITFK